ncbi:MAG: hypothetical protein F9K19_13015 [Rhizobiaceae bacterium]|nr:MAG: hypothetical protein F9K19_13015 [Rhizobiaceae bacterium]
MRPFISRLAAVAAAVLVATPVFAIDILVPGTATPSAAELQIMRSIQSRQDFQLEQRINREIDRLTVQTPSPKLEVPVVKPTCREDVNGQKMLRACR